MGKDSVKGRQTVSCLLSLSTLFSSLFSTGDDSIGVVSILASSLFNDLPSFFSLSILHKKMGGREIVHHPMMQLRTSVNECADTGRHVFFLWVLSLYDMVLASNFLLSLLNSLALLSIRQVDH